MYQQIQDVTIIFNENYAEKKKQTIQAEMVFFLTLTVTLFCHHLCHTLGLWNKIHQNFYNFHFIIGRIIGNIINKYHRIVNAISCLINVFGVKLERPVVLLSSIKKNLNDETKEEMN